MARKEKAMSKQLEKNAEKLWRLVNRISTKEECGAAEEFITKCANEGKIDNGLWDELMTTVAWLYREMNYEERRAYTKPYAM